MAMMLASEAPSTGAEGAVREALAALDRAISCLQAARLGVQAAAGGLAGKAAEAE